MPPKTLKAQLTELIPNLFPNGAGPLSAADIIQVVEPALPNYDEGTIRVALSQIASTPGSVLTKDQGRHGYFVQDIYGFDGDDGEFRDPDEDGSLTNDSEENHSDADGGDAPEASTTVNVALADDELALLEGWALMNNYMTKEQRADYSAALCALVRQLADSGLVVHDDDEAHEIEAPGIRGVGIHLVCRDDRGVTELEDGTFETRAWRVNEKWVRSAAYVALHQRKRDASYRQGRLLEFRYDIRLPDRFVFVVQPMDDIGPVSWPGTPHGAYPVGIRRS